MTKQTADIVVTLVICIVPLLPFVLIAFLESIEEKARVARWVAREARNS